MLKTLTILMTPLPFSVHFPILVPSMFQTLTILMTPLPFSIFFSILVPSMLKTLTIVMPPLPFSIHFPILVPSMFQTLTIGIQRLPFSILFPILVPSMFQTLTIVMPILVLPRVTHIIHPTQSMEYSRFLCQIKVNTLTTHTFNIGAVFRLFDHLSHLVTKRFIMTRNALFRCF